MDLKVLNIKTALKSIVWLGALLFYVPLVINYLGHLIFEVAFPICLTSEYEELKSLDEKFKVVVETKSCSLSHNRSSLSLVNLKLPDEQVAIVSLKSEIKDFTVQWNSNNELIVSEFSLNELAFFREINMVNVILRPEDVKQ